MGRTLGWVACAYAALALWLLGYPDQALQRSHEALTLAQELSHPFSLAFALYLAASLHQLRREVQAAQEQAEAADRARDRAGVSALGGVGHDLAGLGAGRCRDRERRGWRRSARGWPPTGPRGQSCARPYCLALLAEAYGHSGAGRGGAAPCWPRRWRRWSNTGERYWEAELYRLKGELLLRQARGAAGGGGSLFHQALDVARRQQAKSWELRAAMSLARLWQQQGKRAEAHAAAGTDLRLVHRGL